VILTFLATGLRLNELREVRMTDVHLERPLERSCLFVRAATSKSHRSRRVRLDPLAANAVHQYARDWRPEAAGAAPLFLTEKGEPFTYYGFQNYVRRIGDRFKAAGVEHWMAHRCRHYWATSNHRNGMTIFDIAAEGGWKDSEMVRRYTHDRPFEELQAMPTALTAMLRRRAS
jgi:integrase